MHLNAKYCCWSFIDPEIQIAFVKGRGNLWRRAEWVVSLVHLSEYQAIPASATDKTLSPLLLPLSALLKIKSQVFLFVCFTVAAQVHSQEPPMALAEHCFPTFRGCWASPRGLNGLSGWSLLSKADYRGGNGDSEQHAKILAAVLVLGAVGALGGGCGQCQLLCCWQSVSPKPLGVSLWPGPLLQRVRSAEHCVGPGAAGCWAGPGNAAALLICVLLEVY